MLEEYSDVLRVADVCKILGIGKSFAYDLLRENTIPNRKIRRKYIIPKQGVINYLMKISEI